MNRIFFATTLCTLSTLSFISTDAKAETNADGEEITFEYKFEVKSSDKFASQLLPRSCGEGYSTTLSIRSLFEDIRTDPFTCAIGVPAGPQSDQYIHWDPNTGKNEGYPCVVTDRLYQARLMYVIVKFADHDGSPYTVVTQTCARIKPVEKKPF